jgi:Xaa-Pro aminopeptidase
MGKGGKKKSAKSSAAPVVPAPTPVIGWKIEQAEYDARLARVRAILEERKLDALVLFHPIRMAYVSGFFHLSTERPMAIVVSAAGGVGALIPQLEQEHIAKSPAVTNVKIYPEYPTGGTQHPMNHLADLLAEMKLNKPGTRIGADNNGGLDVNGYDGPGLSDVVAEGVEVVKARDLVDKLRAVKSPAELAFIIEATVWGNLAHRLMQERLALGCNEMNVANEASMEASRMMIAALGPTFQPQTRTLGMPPANASYSAGANTSLPHGLSSGAGLRRGDVLVTYAGSEVGGYTTELERTMIVGEPSAEFRERFEQMLALQQVAFDALRPGRALAEVEEDVSNAFKEMGLQEHQRHHTGHGIGLEGHEAPFIDKGDPTVVSENMVFSVEPGLYIPGLAGFRHSDTVVITPNGCERLTYYPRDLESMTVHL